MRIARETYVNNKTVKKLLITRSFRRTYQVECSDACFTRHRVDAGDLQHEDRVRARAALVAVGGGDDPVLLGAAQQTVDGLTVRHVLDLFD